MAFEPQLVPRQPRRLDLAPAPSTEVNDVHSRLNSTAVTREVRVRSLDQLRREILRARDTGGAISMAGGRHSMGGQQFGRATTLLDTRGLSRALGFDQERGLLRVEAGIQWPRLIDTCRELQADGSSAWGIAQKQTGADSFTLAGSLSANCHGRGLKMRPLIGDLESLELIDSRGRYRRCSREENRDLFTLAVGGYGLFGAVYAATVRLTPRIRLQREVAMVDMEDAVELFAERVGDGHLYGDLQFAIDSDSQDFLRRGVMSTYRPVPPETQVTANPTGLDAELWREFMHLAHTSKSEAFERYAAFYRSTAGQVYESDTHQLTTYPCGYHESLDTALGSAHSGSEMITEIYVPRTSLNRTMIAAGGWLRRREADLIYGTIRLIERDDESFLAWAREPWACVVFNLHVEHSPSGLARASETFRGLIDLAIDRGGSYFLPYHRWASREQVLACYPQFPEFLAHKQRLDPQGVFQSDWYRHYEAILSTPPG